MPRIWCILLHMKLDPPAKSVNWTPIVVFLALAILLSSLWAQHARARGMLTNPQNAGIAASVAQAGVLVSALVTMALLARSGFRRIGWRVGPWTAYAAVALILVGMIALMSLTMAFGFQRLAGGKEVPSDSRWMAIPFLIVFAGLFSFAEEFGWRGFLLPRLLPLGTRWALLLSGVLWFCWEAPLVYFGLLDSTLIQLNLPLALVCHFLQTVAIAVAFGYLRLRFDSVFLPTFAHGLLNTLGGVSFLFFTETNPLLSDFGGPIGTALTLVVAWRVWLLVGRDIEQGVLPGRATAVSQRL